MHMQDCPAPSHGHCDHPPLTSEPQMQDGHPDFCAPGVIVIWRQDCGHAHGINETTVGPNLSPKVVVKALEESLATWRKRAEEAEA